MADVHYFIERPGPRSRHAIGHLLGRMAGWEAREAASLADLQAIDGPKLIYGRTAVDGAFHVLPHGLLEEAAVAPVGPPMADHDGLPLLFPVSGGDLPFDLFSGAFFLLSRMEEQAGLPGDRYGRPLTGSIHAARKGYLHRPVVDEWLYLLADAWRHRDPRVPVLRRSYTHTATFDVDNGAMYLGREWWRSLGSAARDLLHLRTARVRDRVSVLLGNRPDPYAVHGRFLDLVRNSGARPIVNFMAAPRGVHDHAVPVQHPYMRAVVAAVADHAEVGLHPSFFSSERPELIAAEKQLLEAVLGRPVTSSRQHFLRLRLPDTIRQLAELGIRDEHSMGMHDRIGFRAGTCTPFPFYDLRAEKPMPLTMHPFAVMDSTLAYQLHLGPAAAVAATKRMVDAVRAVEGTFISVWHERFLSDYGAEAGWGQVADEVLQYARP